MSDTLVSIKKLSKHFGQFVAVDQISFDVKRGEVLGFLGPNGAGKSTTMKMVTGFLVPTKGTASVCGHDIQTDPLAAKAKLGYLPEGAPAWPDMTPHSFLKFCAEVRGFKGNERRDMVEKAVETTQLEDVISQPIETLSKGFKRRVGLAQAILHDPAVLILDEPTDGLDPNQKHEVRSLIRRMAKDKAIILSTHILEEVEAVCTRAMIIARGRVVADGTPDELEARATDKNIVHLSLRSVKAKEAINAIEKLDTVAKASSRGGTGDIVQLRIEPKEGALIVGEVYKLAEEKNWKVANLSVQAGRLDDVFRKLTTDKATA